MSFQRFFGHDIDFDKAATMFTIHHLIYVLCGVFTVFMVLKYAKRIKESKYEHHLKRYWVGLLLILEISYHIHNWTYPRLSLPLHICSFATIMAIYLLLTDNKRVFNYVFFYGTLGGLMALTFPNSVGYTYFNFRYYHFIFLHCTIIAVPLYYYKAYDYRVTYKTLWKVYKSVILLAVIVHLINLSFQHYGIDSNYWFISYVPSNVENIFTNYPFYVVTFMAAVFTSMNILYFSTKDALTDELIKELDTNKT